MGASKNKRSMSTQEAADGSGISCASLGLLSEAEVAHELGVSRKMLASMRSKPGRDPLPFVKIGSRVLYPWADVEKWIKRRTVYSTAEARRVG